ncbi:MULTISPECIES: ABC transporter ATP-binding protein [unclassified Sporolactobacillus]|uniref:ABC transporter ATP-binding protein n=1 Tax=unclassified Sporolactobacillus TaxID=2628533 RepID=UPI00236864C2|nr:ABC transporter ATP-binding protein [Sporolactobacillus sp. CQH2019]MDD9149632.1 ABC transporter ATP-binding protein [Sporolactobacillus sp. CQH2019]
MIRLSKYLLPYRWPIVFSLVFVFLESLADLFLPTIMAEIVDTGIVKKDLPYIWKLGIVMLLVTLLAGGFTLTANYLASKAAAGFGRDVRNRLFARVEAFPLQAFDQVGTASLITRTTNDVAQVEQVCMMILKMIATAPLMCIGGLIMAVYKDARLSLVLAVVLPLIFLSILVLAKKGLPLFKQIQVKTDRLNLILREILTGIRVIRSFNQTKHELGRFNRANREITQTAIRVNQIMAAAVPLIMLIMNLALIAIVWFGSMRIDVGAIQVGDLMAFIQYAMLIMVSILMGAMLFIMIPRAQISAARINEVLDIRTAADNNGARVHLSPADSEPGIVFKDVTHYYPGAEKPALSHLSFAARPGETTAVIGGTGAGKSTLLNLILRFYEPESGNILFNGVDIRKLSLKRLRGMVGYVPQKTGLFTGTVAENVRYGDEQATDQKVWQAIRLAQAENFVRKMAGGCDSLISQGGKNLSGGQKQRLAIARALLRKPAVYLLDDCFSALDYKTDMELRAELKKITNSAIVIVAAQRISTIVHADQIIVLNEGKTAGIGTHQELMASCPVYREIVASQMDREETL